jgi:hypothetical protein
MWAPASERFRLWRMDANGMKGTVMSEWEPLFNRQLKLQWGLYPKREQYM